MSCTISHEKCDFCQFIFLFFYIKCKYDEKVRQLTFNDIADTII